MEEVMASTNMQTSAQGYRSQEEAGDMTSPKVRSKLPGTNQKEMKLQQVTTTEFRIIVLNMPRELQ